MDAIERVCESSLSAINLGHQTNFPLLLLLLLLCFFARAPPDSSAHILRLPANRNRPPKVRARIEGEFAIRAKLTRRVRLCATGGQLDWPRRRRT